MTLADAAWPEIVDRPTVLVPLGATEQHGPHLPLDTDTVIATAVACGAAARIGDEILVAPPVAYGSSGEHQSFAGTSSIGTNALQRLVIELVRSMHTWAGRIVLVNAHGGNITALSRAVPQLAAEGHEVAWIPCATENFDLHAGLTETSLMLHLRPSAVRMDKLESGDTRSLQEILPTLASNGVAAVSANGVLGDPGGATASFGAEILATMVGQTVAALLRGDLSTHGQLGHGDAKR